MSKWHSGPPPSIGWYQASVSQDPEALRWWSHQGVWSKVCRIGDPPARLNLLASIPAFNCEEIEWLERPASWPARSHT